MARVRLFANLREIAGTGRVEVDAETVADVLARLAERFGDTFGHGMSHAKVWVNGDEATPSDAVGPTDEIALIPPVSGGAQTYGFIAGFEPLVVAAGVIALLAANLLFDTVSVMVALLVGLVGLWAVDLSGQSEARGLYIDPWPILAAALFGVFAATGLGAAGMGIGVAFAVVASLGWAVLRPEARELATMGSLVLASLIAAGATSSLTLARLSTSGDDKIAAFVVMSTAS
ncbi:MAG: MoaD/ThiS family protein, partial [Acidimicrobiia bacterium]|nr:MoaD/ThiS family protein [Acidimicrobiia bacterium]